MSVPIVATMADDDDAPKAKMTAGRQQGYSSGMCKLTGPVARLLQDGPFDYYADWSDPAAIEWFEKNSEKVLELADVDPKHNVSWQQFVTVIVPGAKAKPRLRQS